MINVLDLKPGDQLALVGNAKAKVVENMEDGMWVQVEYIEAPDHPDLVGVVELCHAQDILRIVSP